MSLEASFLYVFKFDERWKIPEKSTEKLINFERLELKKFKTYDHATFQEGSPAHSKSVDTKTRPGKRGKPERGQKRCGEGVWRSLAIRWRLQSTKDLQGVFSVGDLSRRRTSKG